MYNINSIVNQMIMDPEAAYYLKEHDELAREVE